MSTQAAVNHHWQSCSGSERWACITTSVSVYYRMKKASRVTNVLLEMKLQPMEWAFLRLQGWLAILCRCLTYTVNLPLA